MRGPTSKGRGEAGREGKEGQDPLAAMRGPTSKGRGEAGKEGKEGQDPRLQGRVYGKGIRGYKGACKRPPEMQDSSNNPSLQHVILIADAPSPAA